MPQLSDSERRSIVAERMASALNTSHSELSAERTKALDFYYGRPLGNEMEGRAQVVSKDMMDTVEWIMPSLLRVFATQNAVQFDPVGPEDTKLAKQETEYTKHVLWKKNNGFMVLYEWLKDALIGKVSYVKYWWQDEESVKFDEYTGLTEDQVTLTLQTLEQQGELEVVGSEQDEKGYHTIKVRLSKRYGCFRYECVAPEEVIVDRNCRGNIKKSRFVGHLRLNVTRSELIEEGYTRKRVEALTSYDWQRDKTQEIARDTVRESMTEELGTDWASQELTLLDCYTYMDADDDGVTELRHFLLAGNDTLEDDEAPEIQWESFSPIPVPHRHVGLSIYDKVEDLQRIKTALQRGLLDNVYFTNAPRYVYDKNTIDLPSLQINRPGAHVANDGPPAMGLVPITVQPIADRLLPVIDYIDSVKEVRTGVGRMSTGVDADVLAQSTKGAYMDAKGAANQLIEAICRIFAETGYKGLFLSCHRMLMHHMDWAERLQIRGQWVEINPTEWSERANLTVSVGLGNSSREEIRANLALMGQAQQQAAAVPGIVQPKNVYALVTRMQAELGLEGEEFFTDPASPEYAQWQKSQQPPPDPYVEGKKIDAQVKTAEIQGRGKEKIIDFSIERARLAQERDLTITELEVKSGVDLAKAGIGAEVAVARGKNQEGAGRAGAAEQPASQ